MKKNKKNNKKIIKILKWLYFSASLIFVALVLAPDIVSDYFRKSPPKLKNEVIFSKEQKLADFESLFETVSTSVPMIHQYKERYGFDFCERKKEYEELIINTNDNLEFFSTMKAVIQEVPGFHSDIVYPNEQYSLNCHNQNRVSMNKTVAMYNQYWYELIENRIGDYCNGYYSFSYVDGEYIFDKNESTSDFDEFLNYRIESINGIDIDTFVTLNHSTMNLYYDEKNNKACRTRVVLNNNDGEDCIVKLSSGNIEKTVKLKMNLLGEMMYCLYLSKSMTKNSQAFQYYCGDDYLYLKIDNMNRNYADNIKKILLKRQTDNIIIDLRDNYGGDINFAERNIYPFLYKDDITEKHEFYIPNTVSNKAIISSPVNKSMLHLHQVKQNPYGIQQAFSGYIESSYNGKSKKDANVVLLVSHKTGSAADAFVYDMKKNSKAVVIGNNTGGEGLMFSFAAENLPNSNLVYIYSPGGVINYEGKDNSVYGTSPDIYSEISYENIKLKNELLIGEENSNFIIRLKWDETLKEAIEYFKQ